jgi:hypothetical protein
MNKFILLVSVVVSLTTASFQVAALADSPKKPNDSYSKSKPSAAGQGISACVEGGTLATTVAETSAELSSIDSSIVNTQIYTTGVPVF